jgi:predicted glycoside hydrolase/deacetylase ChbG (UPF0249 family)
MRRFSPGLNAVLNRVHQAAGLVAGVAVAALCMSASALSAAAAEESTFAERLGWKRTDVVVLLHVDDVGMSHASNLGATEAVSRGVATSWAVMMPCPWVPEIASYLKAHPDIDSGLHITMNSEWGPYRWGPVAGKSQVPGLTDPEGCLWRSAAATVLKGTADEVEREIRAQIDRAETMGLPITHIDSHMGTLFARKEFFERFAKVGIEKRVPILAVGANGVHSRLENGEAMDYLKPWVKQIWNAGLPVLDDLHTGSYGWKPEEKMEKFLQLLRELKPGVTEILFHASRPTEEFPIITSSSESRRADLQCLTDPRVRQLLRERGILQTTWRELAERRRKAADMP